MSDSEPPTLLHPTPLSLHQVLMKKTFFRLRPNWHAMHNVFESSIPTFSDLRPRVKRIRGGIYDGERISSIHRVSLTKNPLVQMC